MKRIVFAIIGVLVLHCAYAEKIFGFELEDIVRNTEGYEFIGNSDDWLVFGYKKHKGTKKKVATLWQMKAGAQFSNGSKSEIEIARCDCEEERYRVVDVTRYKNEWGKGNVTDSFEGSARWIYATPKALSQAILDFCCKK